MKKISSFCISLLKNINSSYFHPIFMIRWNSPRLLLITDVHNKYIKEEFHLLSSLKANFKLQTPRFFICYHTMRTCKNHTSFFLELVIFIILNIKYINISVFIFKFIYNPIFKISELVFYTIKGTSTFCPIYKFFILSPNKKKLYLF